MTDNGTEAQEYLVEIHVKWPPEGDPEMRETLTRGERKRARELAEAGVIQRLWRIPGRWATLGLWRAKDVSALHEAISSLPFFPWLDVSVRPLGDHPSDPRLDPHFGRSASPVRS